jgi:taurine dioxygenase
MRSDVRVRPLRDGLPFGSVVAGINWRTLADEPVRAQLNKIFEDRGLIVFEDIEQTDKMQVALSKVFGSLKDHPTKGVKRAAEGEAAGVIDMHSWPVDDPTHVAGIVEMKGKRVARFSPWHFDHSYNDELNRAGVLASPVSAPEGGRTGFIDGVAIYDRFPRELRDRIEGENVIYTLDTRLTKMRFGVNFKALGDPQGAIDLLGEVAIFPRAIHPAVWTRKTGEKVIHVGAHMSVGLEHHEDGEGDKLLDDVCQEINRMGDTDLAYWHDWKNTEMLIWDNWRVLHAVEGCDAKYERHTKRTTIAGDYGLGYFEDGKKIGEVMREVAL